MLGLPEKDKQALRARFEGAAVDAASFQKLYAWCNIAECRGMCCRGGVWLEPEEATFIKQNESYLREKLPAIGLNLDPNYPVLDESEVMDRFTAGTNTKPFDYSDQGNFSKEWDQTSCVFRRDDGACGLQALAMAEGKNPWHYKPLYCFLFPIDIADEDGKMVITLEDSSIDGFSAMCGNVNKNGKPGYEIFEREITALSEILGRDLMAEIKAGIKPNEPLLYAV